MTDEYRFVVRGLPQPKGSARAFVVRGRAVVTSDTKGLKSWEQTIRFQLQDFEGPVWEGPIGLALTFYLPRPQSAPKRVLYPFRKPDLSKLWRGAEDALSGIVIRDDAQIVTAQIDKRFATDFVGVEGRVWRVIGGHEAQVLAQEALL